MNYCYDYLGGSFFTGWPVYPSYFNFNSLSSSEPWLKRENLLYLNVGKWVRNVNFDFTGGQTEPLYCPNLQNLYWKKPIYCFFNVSVGPRIVEATHEVDEHYETRVL